MSLYDSYTAARAWAANCSATLDERPADADSFLLPNNPLAQLPPLSIPATYQPSFQILCCCCES